ITRPSVAVPTWPVLYSTAQWRRSWSVPVGSRRSFCPLSFRRRVPAPASARLAWCGPVKVLPALSSRTTRWKSARLHGGVMSQLLSVPLQNGLRFLQHPLPATPSAFLADAPAFTRRRDVGFAMFDCDDMNESAPASTPAAGFVRVLRLHGWSTLAALPFGSSLAASLARCILRCLWQFTCVGHFHPALSLRPR